MRITFDAVQSTPHQNPSTGSVTPSGSKPGVMRWKFNVRDENNNIVGSVTVKTTKGPIGNPFIDEGKVSFALRNKRGKLAQTQHSPPRWTVHDRGTSVFNDTEARVKATLTRIIEDELLTNHLK